MAPGPKLVPGASARYENDRGESRTHAVDVKPALVDSPNASYSRHDDGRDALDHLIQVQLAGLLHVTRIHSESATPGVG